MLLFVEPISLGHSGLVIPRALPLHKAAESFISALHKF